MIKNNKNSFEDSASPAGFSASISKVISDILSGMPASQYRKKHKQSQFSKGTLFYSQIIESLEDYAVFTIDIKGFIQSWNSGAERTFGYNEAEILGKNTRIFFTPIDQKNSAPEGERQIALTIGKANNERWYVRKDKSRFWGSGVVFPLRNEEGVLQGFTKIMRDLTSRQIAQDKLERSEEQFRTLADTVPHMVWMTNPQGKILYTNKRFKEWTGLTTNDLNSGKWGKIIHPDDMPKLAATAKIAYNKESPYSVEFRIKNQKGDYFWVMDSAIPVKDDRGVITKWIGTTTNIDEQKKMEEQKTEFLGIVTHELKTPLTSVKAFAQILERRFIQKKDMASAELLSKMDSQLHKLQVIIADLLDITKIESGRLRFNQQSFLIYEVVKEVVEETTRMSPEHRITIEGKKDVMLFADRDKVGQLLTNLITNAIKYSKEKEKIIVKIKQNDKFLTLSVQDFGIGIPKKLQDKIFQRFYRAPGKNSETFPGLGLGLYITKEIAHLHQADIHVQSAPGKGSTFFVDFPLAVVGKNKK